MRVLSAGEVAEWFQGFENLGIESDYAHADKDGLFSLIPRPPVSTWDTHQNLNGCLSLRVTSQL